MDQTKIRQRTVTAAPNTAFNLDELECFGDGHGLPITRSFSELRIKRAKKFLRLCRFVPYFWLGHRRSP
jgi:hypothetical protein